MQHYVTLFKFCALSTSSFALFIALESLMKQGIWRFPLAFFVVWSSSLESTQESRGSVYGTTLLLGLKDKLTLLSLDESEHGLVRLAVSMSLFESPLTEPH